MASMDLEDDQARTRNIELNEFTAKEVSFHINQLNQRSEERRVGKECSS